MTVIDIFAADRVLNHYQQIQNNVRRPRSNDFQSALTDRHATYIYIQVLGGIWKNSLQTTATFSEVNNWYSRIWLGMSCRCAVGLVTWNPNFK